RCPSADSACRPKNEPGGNASTRRSLPTSTGTPCWSTAPRAGFESSSRATIRGHAGPGSSAAPPATMVSSARGALVSPLLDAAIGLALDVLASGPALGVLVLALAGVFALVLVAAFALALVLGPALAFALALVLAL